MQLVSSLLAGSSPRTTPATRSAGEPATTARRATALHGGDDGRDDWAGALAVGVGASVRSHRRLSARPLRPRGARSMPSTIALARDPGRSRAPCGSSSRVLGRLVAWPVDGAPSGSSTRRGRDRPVEAPRTSPPPRDRATAPLEARCRRGRRCRSRPGSRRPPSCSKEPFPGVGGDGNPGPERARPPRLGIAALLDDHPGATGVGGGLSCSRAPRRCRDVAQVSTSWPLHRPHAADPCAEARPATNVAVLRSEIPVSAGANDPGAVGG